MGKVAYDIAIVKSVEMLDLSELPYEGECLIVATKNLENYCEKIEQYEIALSGYYYFNEEISNIYDIL